MKQKEQANMRIQNAVKKAALGGLDRYSVQRDQNLTEQKQQQESILASEGSNLGETGSTLHYPGQVWEMPY